MELSKDLQELLSSFDVVNQKSLALVEEIEGCKKDLHETELQLKEQVSTSEKLREELQSKQEIIDMIHKQLSVIPVLQAENLQKAQKIEELMFKLESKDEEINKLKSKHYSDISSLNQEKEEETRKEREEEKKRTLELEEFYTHAHETEVSSLSKRHEKEKELLKNQIRMKEEMMEKMKSDHEGTVMGLKLQLHKVKESQLSGSATGSVNSEFYRKKIVAMQEHYEKQIQDLLVNNSKADVMEQRPQHSATPKKTLSRASEAASAVRRLGHRVEPPAASPRPQSTMTAARNRGSSPPDTPRPQPLSSRYPPPPATPAGSRPGAPFHEDKKPGHGFEPPTPHVARGLPASPFKDFFSSPAPSAKKKKVRFSLSSSCDKNKNNDNKFSVTTPTRVAAPPVDGTSEDFWKKLETENQSMMQDTSPLPQVDHDPGMTRQKEETIQQTSSTRFKFSSVSCQQDTEFGTFKVSRVKEKTQGPMKRKLFNDKSGPQEF